MRLGALEVLGNIARDGGRRSGHVECFDSISRKNWRIRCVNEAVCSAWWRTLCSSKSNQERFLFPQVLSITLVIYTPHPLPPTSTRPFYPPYIVRLLTPAFIPSSSLRASKAVDSEPSNHNRPQHNTYVGILPFSKYITVNPGYYGVALALCIPSPPIATSREWVRGKRGRLAARDERWSRLEMGMCRAVNLSGV
jgi:hypothetical protein